MNRTELKWIVVRVKDVNVPCPYVCIRWPDGRSAPDLVTDGWFDFISGPWDAKDRAETEADMMNGLFEIMES